MGGKETDTILTIEKIVFLSMKHQIIILYLSVMNLANRMIRYLSHTAILIHILDFLNF